MIPRHLPLPDWDTLAWLPDPWAAGGMSERSQTVRFEQLVAITQPGRYDTVLDYGCGTGRLASFLPEHTSYVGWDSSRAMRQRARLDVGDRGHIYEHMPAGRYAVVICCGVFNLKRDGTVDEALAKLERLYVRSTGRVLAASMLCDDSDDRCNRYDPELLADFADDLAVRWRVVDDHLPNDVIVALWHF